MFRSLLLGGLLAVGLASAAAADPFQDYLDFCVTTDGAAPAAGSAAQAAGWFKLPTEAFGEEAPFRDPSVYLSHDPAGLSDKGPPPDFRLLVSGWDEGEAVFGLNGMRLDLCSVAVAEADFAALRTRLAAYFGFPSVMIDGEEVWAWSRQGAQMRSEAAIFAEGQDPSTAIMGRKVFVAGMLQEDGMVMLILGALRPSR